MQNSASLTLARSAMNRGFPEEECITRASHSAVMSGGPMTFRRLAFSVSGPPYTFTHIFSSRVRMVSWCVVGGHT